MFKVNEAYELNLNNSPLIVMTPHSGRNYDKKFLKYANLKINELRNTEDFYVDNLFFPKKEEFSFLKATFPRVFIDANRSPLEIDQTMWEESNLQNIFDQDSFKVLNGIGVFAKFNLFGKYIYSRKIPFKDAKWRLFNFYFPYHRSIKEIVAKAKKNHKKIVALDCHSMSSGLVSKNVDIVISNRDNKSSSKEILYLIKKSFINQNYRIGINDPFKGGFITSYYGKPEKNVHFLQIEINKGLYMCEKTLSLKKKSFLKLKHCFDNLINDILLYLHA